MFDGLIFDNNLFDGEPNISFLIFDNAFCDSLIYDTNTIDIPLNYCVEVEILLNVQYNLGVECVCD